MWHFKQGRTKRTSTTQPTHLQVVSVTSFVLKSIRGLPLTLIIHFFLFSFIIHTFQFIIFPGCCRLFQITFRSNDVVIFVFLVMSPMSNAPKSLFPDKNGEYSIFHPNSAQNLRGWVTTPGLLNFVKWGRSASNTLKAQCSTVQCNVARWNPCLCVPACEGGIHVFVHLRAREWVRVRVRTRAYAYVIMPCDAMRCNACSGSSGWRAFQYCSVQCSVQSGERWVSDEWCSVRCCVRGVHCSAVCSAVQCNIVCVLCSALCAVYAVCSICRADRGLQCV